LTSRYAEIQDRLSKISRERQHVNKPLEKDFAEQATETENDEVLDALDLKIRAEMSMIEQTLERLKSGDYGICSECGEKIPEKRLMAMPEAIRCISCEEEAASRNR
jgi:RNA polymerase-binding transcription factor DksA